MHSLGDHSWSVAKWQALGRSCLLPSLWAYLSMEEHSFPVMRAHPSGGELMLTERDLLQKRASVLPGVPKGRYYRKCKSSGNSRQTDQDGPKGDREEKLLLLSTKAMLLAECAEEILSTPSTEMKEIQVTFFPERPVSVEDKNFQPMVLWNGSQMVNMQNPLWFLLSPTTQIQPTFRWAVGRWFPKHNSENIR